MNVKKVDILRRKSSDELRRMWEDRDAFPPDTIAALHTVIDERKLAQPVPDEVDKTDKGDTQTAAQKSATDKEKVATWAGFAGGGVFFILNLATGAVPGGFEGGILGFILGYGLARLVLALIPSK